MATRDDVQKIADIARDGYRKMYAKAGAPSVETMLDAVQDSRMYVTNAYQSDTGMWHAHLRFNRERRVLAGSGVGADLAEALFHAMREAKKSPPPKPAPSDDLDFL